MAMKKIKPQYGKVVPPAIGNAQETDDELTEKSGKPESGVDISAVENGEISTKNELEAEAEKSDTSTPKKNGTAQKSPTDVKQKGSSRLTSEPNPFLQAKEIFGKARLTKVGYRVRTEFVEILDFIKKMKRNGYTLEAVLDDALAFYFENSEDGREAIKKAEIFYS